METLIPVFPCKSLQAMLDFYRTLGFEVTYQQEQPYIYASVSRDRVNLHFSKLTTFASKSAVCLIFVADIQAYHRNFADALRTKYLKVPTVELPRITRYRQGQTRFHIFDPSGNILIFIAQNEGDTSYEYSQEGLSASEQALENAIFLRDTYVNDKAAAGVLDKALQRVDATPLEHARLLAMRAEIAVATGDMDTCRAIRDKLQQISLSPDEQKQYQHELEASHKLERWITHEDNQYYD